MSKKKMSLSDKITRLQKRISKTIDDFDLFVDEASTIRNKTLKTLLALEYEMKINRSIPPYDVQGIIEVLNCEERTAYDYQKTMLFLHVIHSRYQDYLEELSYIQTKRRKV